MEKENVEGIEKLTNIKRKRKIKEELESLGLMVTVGSPEDPVNFITGYIPSSTWDAPSVGEAA